MQLNKEQEKAAKHWKGPCLVVSVPGSGKTRVLVERVVNLIEEYGEDERRIINVTFTNKAANEMSDRISKRLGRTPSMLTCTFHALAIRIIRNFHHLVDLNENFTIIDSDDQKATMGHIIESVLQEKPEEESIQANALINYYNKAREEGIDVDPETDDHPSDPDWINYLDLRLGDVELVDKAIRVLDAYGSYMLDHSMVDFSGLLYHACKILKNPDARTRLQLGCHFMQVDEVQDTNWAQFFIAETLTAQHNNLFIVGDFNQSVYSWRGARPENINDFISNHEDNNLEIINLPQNYRSTPEIIDAAWTLIQHNESHMGDSFVTENKSGDEVNVDEYNSPSEEANVIASKIKRFIHAGLSPSNIVILYRVNSMSRSVEEACVRASIPYKIVGGFSFYNRKEIKDMLAFLKLAVNPLDTIAFNRVMKVLAGVGPTNQTKIEKVSLGQNIGFVEAAKRLLMSDQFKGKAVVGIEKFVKAYSLDFSEMKAGDIMEHIMDNIEYLAYVRKQKTTKGKASETQERLDNIKELLQSARSEDNADLSATHYLQKVGLITSTDVVADKNKITLMTLHAVKGLEFKIVFMIGVEEDMLPHMMALKDEEGGGEEEERRLCYVGMTRAEKRLYISHCSRRPVGWKGEWRNSAPSRFLYESGLMHARV